MTFIATPDVNDSPPSVELDYTLDTPGSIVSYEITRNGETLRFNTVPSGDQIILTDYEAEYGVPLAYTISGDFLPDVVADWTEVWASDAAWSGDTADWTTAAGEALSSVLNADITRSASGTIEKIEVDDPNFLRIELLDVANVVVASVTLTTSVTLTGTTGISTAGGGSFQATLIDGTIAASANDASWGLTRPYTGIPTKVRLVSLAQAEGTYLKKIGTAGSGNGQFNQPTGVAFDSVGNFFVVDFGNHRVQKFNSAGVYQSKFGSVGAGNGQFSDMYGGIAIDSNDNIFVVDTGNARVQKFDSSGAYVSKFGTSGTGDGQFSSPYGIAIDSADNVFVVDSDIFTPRVQKFNNSGVYQSKFGAAGSGNGQFNDPYGIAIDSADNIFVTEQGNDRVQKFNSAGAYQSKFGTPGTGNGQFDSPRGIDLDSSGNIWVVDSSNERVQKFNSAGVYQSQFGSSGTGNGQMLNAYGMAVDPSDQIYVADTNNNRVQVFSGVSIPASVGEISVYLPVAVVPFSDSAETQLDSEDAWMVHPLNTGLSVNIHRAMGCQDGIQVSDQTKKNRNSATRRVLLNPVGRTRSIAITQQDRMVGTWDLVLIAETIADRDEIDAFLMADVPFLLRSPTGFGWDLPDDWYSAGDVNDLRLADPLVLPCGHHFHLVTLPLVPVDQPTEPTPAGWTYGQDLLAYLTYADSLAAEPTYLDRLIGPST